MSYPVYTVPAGDVLPVFFSTYGKTNGESITMTGLAVTDIEIYKDGSTTQRASDSGYTLLDTDGIDFDGITGIHGFSIDTGDNTDAGFYTVGSWFHVVVSAVTVDGQTVNFIAAAFRIMPAEAVAGTPKVDVGAWKGSVPANLADTDKVPVSVQHWSLAAITTNITGSMSGSVGSISDITFPTNFGVLSINGSGHIERVTLVDTTTTNTDMRGTDNALLAGSYTAPDNAGIAEIGTNVGTLLGRIPAALFAGITSLAQWLGLIAGKQVGNSTARTELRATGAGSGTYDETTDSIEAIRDTADAIELDTQDLQDRTPAALVGGRTPADIGTIAGDPVADKLPLIGGIPVRHERVGGAEDIDDVEMKLVP